MGKIKSKSIKRSANILIKKGIEFSDRFTENKIILEGVMPSKKLRNQTAGYIARLKKRENTGK